RCLDRGHDRHFLGGPEARGSRAAIGPYKTARAQQDAPKPARDHYGDMVEGLTVQCLQDRLARRAARLAIIAEAIVLADAPGPAIMVRIRLRVRGDEFLRRSLA